MLKCTTLSFPFCHKSTSTTEEAPSLSVPETVTSFHKLGSDQVAHVTDLAGDVRSLLENRLLYMHVY